MKFRKSSALASWRRPRGIALGLPFLAVWLTAAAGSAELVRFEIASREPFAGGQTFGGTGSYERIVGRVYFELDPKQPQNRNVVDLELAERNQQGKVELFGDLFVLAPKDLSKGNGALLYDVNNRGNKLALGMFNYGGGGNDPRLAEHAGDAFLFRQGFTVVWSGWDGELLPGNNRLRLAVPLARDKRESIKGLVRCEIVPTSNVQRTVVNWANHGSYRPTDPTLADATLTHRLLPGDARAPVPRDQWQAFVTEVNSEAPHQLPKIEVELASGFKRAHIYELIYEARDPLIMGTCFTAVRDLVAAIKHGSGRDNPFVADGKSAIRRAHAFGVSQSGRFLRELLYWGFNEDEQGRQVFDGIIPHVAGSGLGSFNHRFAQPTRHAAQHDHHDYPPDRFPFSYEVQQDPLSGQKDGILRRALASGTAPMVFHTQSAAEYWTRSGSLTHTDPLGRRDAQPPKLVRFYSFGGTQHGPSGFPPNRGDGQNLTNPGDYKPFLRALLLALDRWARDGTSPPPSVYPTVSDGTLVDWRQASTGFPKIPGIRYPQVIQQPSLLDFGPRWASERIVDRQPPIPRGDYRVLAPRCGADGNELGMLLPPEVAVPTATYTGWNLRRKDAGAENELVSLRGSYLPFAKTKAKRLANGDPRLSLEERYGSQEKYLEKLAAECQRLNRAGYLTREDATRILRVHRGRTQSSF